MDDTAAGASSGPHEGVLTFDASDALGATRERALGVRLVIGASLAMALTGIVTCLVPIQSFNGSSRWALGVAAGIPVVSALVVILVTRLRFKAAKVFAIIGFVGGIACAALLGEVLGPSEAMGFALFAGVTLIFAVALAGIAKAEKPVTAHERLVHLDREREAVARRASAAAAREQVQLQSRAEEMSRWEANYRRVHDGEEPPAGLALTVQEALPKPGTNGMAILAFASLFFLPPLGVVAGHIALRQLRRYPEGGRGLAIAALVGGYAFLAALVGLPVVLLIAASV